jgi:uncharacterized protein YkwD
MSHTITLRRLALMALVSAAGAAAVPAVSSAAQPCIANGSARVPTEVTLQEAAASAARAINRERAVRDLVPLGVDPRLALAAQRHARDMVRRGFFSHVTPDGRGMTARVRVTGYLRNAAAWALGETLAWGAGSCSTPAAAVAAWMESPPHRRVILSRRYLQVGVGVAIGLPLGPAPAAGATYAAELGYVRP